MLNGYLGSDGSYNVLGGTMFFGLLRVQCVLCGVKPDDNCTLVH